QDGASPWRITPAGVECLANQTKKVVSGTELTLLEFDLVTPIVFTSDWKQIAEWQNYYHDRGKLAAEWATHLAKEEYEKVRTVHMKLSALNSPPIREADVLFKQSFRFREEALRDFAAGLYDKSYQNAIRALRPLRIIMHDHWQLATATLDIPTASPYAVSF